MTIAVDWDIKNQTKQIKSENHPDMFEKLFTGMKADKTIFTIKIGTVWYEQTAKIQISLL